MAKIDRIKISMEFKTHSGNGVWLTAECPVAPDEDVVEEFKKGRSTIIEAYNSFSNNELSMNVTQIEKTEYRMEDAINSCTDIGVLVTYKLLVRGKPDLQAAYDKKFAELKG